MTLPTNHCSPALLGSLTRLLLNLVVTLASLSQLLLQLSHSLGKVCNSSLKPFSGMFTPLVPKSRSYPRPARADRDSLLEIFEHRDNLRKGIGTNQCS